jgi:hypothetical protein
MVGWLPVLKAVLPHLGPIVSRAVPMFTARKDANIAQQIAELQEAVSGNAASVKDLARELQRVVEAIEAAALASETEIKRLRRITLAAAVIALLAAAAALAALLR